MFHCKDQQAMATVMSLQQGGQWAVDYLSFICASEGQFHNKSVVIEFVSHLYWPPLEYDVTAKTKSHSQTVHSEVRGNVITLRKFNWMSNAVFSVTPQHAIFSSLTWLVPLKPSLGTVQQVIYIVQVTERPRFTVNSSRVAWSDVWLWPIRLAGGRFMTETAISLPLSLSHTHIHFANPHTMLFYPL